MPMPRRSHQKESLDRLNNPFGEAKGTPLSGLMARGRPLFPEQTLVGCQGRIFAVGARSAPVESFRMTIFAPGTHIAGTVDYGPEMRPKLVFESSTAVPASTSTRSKHEENQPQATILNIKPPYLACNRHPINFEV
jgi:hypothetical protein